MKTKSASDWDERYRESETGLFGDAPNEYLRMVCARHGFMPQTALLPADGDGRNGTWLAGRDMDVTAFDLSPEATRLAQARDTAAGVSVERFCADVMDWQPEAGRRWEAVMIFYLHGPTVLRQTAMEKAMAALAPGGWLVLEGFAKAAEPSSGQRDSEARYNLSELERWANGLEIVELMAGKLLLDEGSRHQGLANVARLIARVR